MKFVYIDEQEAENEQGKYTSATALVFDSETMVNFRDALIKGLLLIVFPDREENTEVRQLPVLHGVEMLEGEPDRVKFAVYQLVVDLIVQYEVSIFRLGYYDKSTAPFLKTSAARKSYSVFWLLHGVTDTLKCEQIHIYELDTTGHPHMTAYNDTYFQEMLTQMPKENFSTRFSNEVMGRFYCDKQNHFMYCTDLVSWVLMKAEKENRREYADKIVELATPINDRIILNRLVYMNSKSGQPTQ